MAHLMNSNNIQPLAPPPKKGARDLYVGGLSPQITDHLLYTIFAAYGTVTDCKVIKDKTSGVSLGYGFVQYSSSDAAQNALQTLHGKKVYNSEIKVNWAHAANKEEDSQRQHTLFIGDLSGDVNEETLRQAFSVYGTTICDARIMWDPNTGRSRGYGFVAFRDKADAESALLNMNGQFLGSRAIRVNWAHSKSEEDEANAQLQAGMDFDSVKTETSPTNTTVYVGNLAPEANEQTVREHFSVFGSIVEVRYHTKGYAFVVYTDHEAATKAIVTMNGQAIGKKRIKTSWGKESNSTAATPAVAPQAANPYFQQGYYAAQPYLPPTWAQQYGAQWGAGTHDQQWQAAPTPAFPHQSYYQQAYGQAYGAQPQTGYDTQAAQAQQQYPAYGQQQY
eukprot:TRINITY_DN1888_c0_g1::TRINITY_DN1888_c0_g1_i1::g.14106::m.14106 TRINITY_DN1888_c0_g1::TRINITY_DN1888_c0_g1_i1::g.14106  ORF type:complete len:414 (-),score=81.11,sp/Q9M427/UBP1_NICPL/42.01/2e-65,sp/Q9M427/UBP1_NICPL/36.84/4e-06,RRM_1/PF00076.17/1.5e-19,RRM_1/PF00076.17/2.6e-20,RRM_1/PF00076.17/4.5e-18,RRM_6/PF14259.1/4.3e-13,RRM_6/PF14259.1/1.8e-13,RRM_6/PF14259.1/2.6e-11,RRM_5/PF13893.1/1.6e-12,RRM_5/PF13893.1/2.9e-06,RRM_5/PF13893.1/8.6e-08,Nup35_RRM_2/PF14605.1/47,Nup35_RRM_2/PF14605.1/3.8e+0